MPRSATDQENRASAVGKAFAVLRVLRRSPNPMTLTAVAESVHIAPSSAHSVLTQLLKEGAVVQDADKRYELGPALFYLGSSFARGSRIYRAVWMELVQAANELAVTAALAVEWDGHHLVLNSHRAGDSDVRVPFGGRVPIDGGSWGKVHFAWSDAELPDKLPGYTDASITDLDRFRNEIAIARRLGYATDLEEFAAGVGGVAAPVTSRLGYEGVASFLAPRSRVEEIGIGQLGGRIAGLAARASLALGDKERVRLYGFE
jgi:IclR family transcriptional regulator, acetate operon repressor